MQKWNLIIDVAECTNCNLCTLSAMDEYVGNDFPGYTAPMPKHGHKWINILQKERGQVPMIDIAYVPTMCNHCDDAPCIKAASDGAVGGSAARAGMTPRLSRLRAIDAPETVARRLPGIWERYVVNVDRPPAGRGVTFQTTMPS